ncbi:MAG: 1-deoxy-D-xylulose-5-phosphate reductoisomerase [Kiritimatiellae bacterium]|nr:1-deoxy-D-xylulose-5-phosphate reductoisomerase [Kiritimatiellia bacterium]
MNVQITNASEGRRRIVLLGATGSIGQTALALLRGNPRYRVVGLSAHSNAEALARDALALGVRHICLSDPVAADRLALDLPPGLVLHKGEAGLVELAALDADVLLCAVVGMAGLRPVLAAIESGKDVALATKEVLVAAGEIVMRRRRERGVRILPIDSEHSAIFQALQSPRHSVACTELPGDGLTPAASVVRRLILTASGGPFFSRRDLDFASVTVGDALNHPIWAMGRKVTIDSATMMNKGLEIIEARWLFDIPGERIEVLVHPESVVHSIVEYCDLTQVAELSVPDMAFAVNYALSWPDRVAHRAGRPLDLAEAGTLHFESPDKGRFPCLALAMEALSRGGTSPAILNAANEVAVNAFLSGRIGFPDIWRIVSRALDGVAPRDAADLEAIHASDAEARAFAVAFL